MPVYLCKPGCWASEPWRHGIQVYAFPFHIDTKVSGQPYSSSSSSDKTVNRHATSSLNPIHHHENDDMQMTNDTAEHQQQQGVAIRRVRHAEMVLVDDVCVDYGRYWLRLRWPGSKGGFAGYIALGAASPSPMMTKRSNSEISETVPTGEESPVVEQQSFTTIQHEVVEEISGGYFAPTASDDEGEQQLEKHLEIPPLQCLRTGLYFPSSSAMQLLASYDDGLALSHLEQKGEPVFCRICREGLHDDEEQAPDESSSQQSQQDHPETEAAALAFNSTSTTTMTMTAGPIQPHPPYHSNNYASENPMLAPCECSGSMAFVHYLCVEQWRCRSRHPEARNGLNCETCNTPYALPPPSSRPMPSHHQHHPVEDDWLEAMPAHVMAALREPHVWWQLSAAIVRRRWLRPIAPILMSPCVALYCRARRLLKKRGVSRRRWACSLCRRRARWKCVRCVRSYYCSRHCQNVSWHIVHKHVCYKPSRFWWSTVVYSVAALLLFPGIWKDPLIYDFGFMLVPLNFFVVSVLAGGMATLLKKAWLVDLRGRLLEVSVVFITLWLTSVSWGLTWAFFGNTASCHGVFGLSSSQDSKVLEVVRRFVLSPGEAWFSTWDRFFLSSPLRRWMCRSEDSCFAHSQLGNASFYLESEACASDVLLVSGLWMAAAVVLVIMGILKKHERRLRVARGGRRRPHED